MEEEKLLRAMKLSKKVICVVKNALAILMYSLVHSGCSLVFASHRSSAFSYIIAIHSVVNGVKSNLTQGELLMASKK